MVNRSSDFIKIPDQFDYLAPDGSEIRLLSSVTGGELAHCTLPPNAITQAVMHKAVREIWHFTEGVGEIWRKDGVSESVVRVFKDSTVVIHPLTSFQFRSVGPSSLKFVVFTVPG